MDWFADALSRLLAWFNQLVVDVQNFFIAFLINPLLEQWNGLLSRLLDPQRYFPRFDVLARIAEVLAFAVDYVRLVWLLVDSVMFAPIVAQIVVAYLVVLPFALVLRAWFILRRTALVS